MVPVKEKDYFQDSQLTVSSKETLSPYLSYCLFGYTPTCTPHSSSDGEKSFLSTEWKLGLWLAVVHCLGFRCLERPFSSQSFPKLQLSFVSSKILTFLCTYANSELPLNPLTGIASCTYHPLHTHTHTHTHHPQAANYC